MKFRDIELEFEKYSTLDIIAESQDPEVPTQSTYSNEGANDPYEDDKF